MKIVKLFQKYINSRQELPSWVRCWKHRLSLLLAFIVPGLPHLLSKNRLLLGKFLFFFGTGALINMMLCLFLFDGIRAFDYTLIFARTFDYPNMYPMRIASFVESTERLIPIDPPREPYFVQPFFWELLYAHIILYVVCAIISFWDQWKTGNNVAGSKIAE